MAIYLCAATFILLIYLQNHGFEIHMFRKKITLFVVLNYYVSKNIRVTIPQIVVLIKFLFDFICIVLAIDVEFYFSNAKESHSVSDNILGNLNNTCDGFLNVIQCL